MTAIAEVYSNNNDLLHSFRVDGRCTPLSLFWYLDHMTTIDLTEVKIIYCKLRGALEKIEVVGGDYVRKNGSGAGQN